ncbi:MAG: DUF2855 family protein [Acidobacteriota bacterium]
MTSTLEALDFVVQRPDFSQHKIVSSTPAGLEQGQISIRVDRFAFTANNITYAVVGDLVRYWSFFPADEGWGRIPVWGFGDVAQSRHDAIDEGERLYGYFPMSTHLTVQPDRFAGPSFLDFSAHRRDLNAIYNQYFRTHLDPSYDPRYENLQALFRPLFTTSFLIDDFLIDNELFGASSVVLSSASSKTALGVAYALQHNRPDRKPYDIVGLTSPGNVAFVERLGFYDQVLTYDAVPSLPAETPAVYVDLAGNSKLRSDLHHHFRNALKYSCQVGLSHWSQAAPADALPGPEPQQFFAPTQAQKRSKEWGPEVFQQRLGAAWMKFRDIAEQHIEVITGQGSEAVARVYLETLQGKVDPRHGHILSL